jgi:hypothetical protein
MLISFFKSFGVNCIFIINDYDAGLCEILFICGLFNDAVSSSGNTQTTFNSFELLVTQSRTTTIIVLLENTSPYYVLCWMSRLSKLIELCVLESAVFPFSFILHLIPHLRF